MAGDNTDSFLEFFGGKKISFEGRMNAGNALQAAPHFIQLKRILSGIEERIPGDATIISIKENHKSRGTKIFTVFGNRRGTQASPQSSLHSTSWNSY